MSLNPNDHENSPHLNASDLGLIDFRKKERESREEKIYQRPNEN